MGAYVVAVTGGIASGKTAFAEYLNSLGADLLDADVVAREVVETGSDALADIAAHFGQDILLSNGTLDRAALRKRVFESREERTWLEALLHPLIRARLHEQANASTASYVVTVIPLLTESGGRKNYPWVDRIAVVDVPESVQAERLMARDKTDADMARKMIAAQATREQRLGIADDVISNTSSFEQLQRSAQCLDILYKNLA
ncbi:dephospho-CoA kinase [Lysobacter sp. HDW10]|uniref:dephospho-CoA kinase n=1 Tax=Lysobacter sp. HDW10 TaxID=2714936 RepID=UPI00140D1FCA|nr:dephospho-CoA kinase [Lysobacter sp. HDW10]QIK80350.1 dephospho-CoA kinase [Lysobacter sp. HDW10]